jgi:hypothetical protein
MLDELKNLAARQLGKALASDTTMKVLSNQQIQSAMMRAINLRAEARDLVESRIQGVATALDLVTHDDVAALKRTMRDLEDTIEELRDELADAQGQPRETTEVDIDAVIKAAAEIAVKQAKAKKNSKTSKKNSKTSKKNSKTSKKNSKTSKKNSKTSKSSATGPVKAKAKTNKAKTTRSGSAKAKAKTTRTRAKKSANGKAKRS